MSNIRKAHSVEIIDRRLRQLEVGGDLDAMDLVGLYRDALARSYGSTATATHPDMAEQAERMARAVSPEALLRSIEAILECRESLAVNAKPKFAIYALVGTLGDVLR